MNDAPETPPRGHFPGVRRAGDFLYVSGTSARSGENFYPGVTLDRFGSAQIDIRAQTAATIANIAGALAKVGAGLEDVVEIVSFLVNMNDFQGYNEVYNQHFGTDGPTRTTVAVHQLPHPHIAIEMKAVAYKKAV